MRYVSNGPCKACAIGALSLVINPNNLEGTATIPAAILDALVKEIPKGVLRGIQKRMNKSIWYFHESQYMKDIIYNYNDARGRKKEDVLALFDRAAERLAAK